MSDLGLQDVKEKITQPQLEAIEVIEEYLNSDDNKYQALVKMPTGERVIIVMGAVNVMKPRVSGTLNKYILCIA